MTHKIYQIEIALKEFTPRIWRRLLIPSDFLLEDFHRVLQTTMGWTNTHLHQFVKDDAYYRLRSPHDEFWEDEADLIDYYRMKISDLLKKEKDIITYEYDFGGNWCHAIVLEKIYNVNEELECPICLKGEMNRPPEDCGGVIGYSNLLKILKQPNHPEYQSYLDHVGGNFLPEYFNRGEVNRKLQNKNYGCI